MVVPHDENEQRQQAFFMDRRPQECFGVGQRQVTMLLGDTSQNWNSNSEKLVASAVFAGPSLEVPLRLLSELPIALSLEVMPDVGGQR